MAGNQLSSNLQVLLAKAETTYGTDPTPTEGMDLRGSFTTSEDKNIIERARVQALEGGVPHGVIKDKVSYSGTVAVGGVEDVDGGTPGVHPLLIAGGFEAALSGTSGAGNVEAAYNMRSTNKGSCAMYFMLVDVTSNQKIRLKLLGCRNNVEFAVALNGELMLNFSGQALYAEWEAVATIANPSRYGKGLQSLMCTNLTHTIGGSNVRIKGFSFNTNLQPAPEEAVNGSSNAQEIGLFLGDSRPGGSIDPIALSTDFAASGSYMDKARTGETFAHALSFNDGVSSFAYAAPVAQLGTESIADDGAFKRFSFPFFVNDDSSGDDAVSITFGSV